MQKKGLRTCLVVAIGLIVLVGVFAAGVGVGYFTPQLFGDTIQPSTATVCPPCPEVSTDDNGSTVVVEPTACPVCPYIDYSGDTPEEYQDLFAPFWEAWALVHEEYVDQPVDDTLLMQGAIEGMLASLGDKHTSYMDPDVWQQANESLVGEYGGIGAWVNTSGDYVEILRPMKGSPAYEAGLQANDLVIGINGDDMTGIPGDIVLKQILGPAGTDVTLTIQRGEEIFDVTITRAQIVVPVVEYEMLENNIGYVALYTYGDNSTEQLRAAIADLLSQGAAGLIFDLRDNGGGYLNTAIEVVSEFIGNGVVMYEQFGDGTTLTYEAIPGGQATEIPLVVLVNENTASASEITAGAIQDLGRAPLVGALTYGKGSVQNWVELDDNAGGVRVTIARWLTPDGRQISDVGLTPEYIVDYTLEDFEAGLDPQLDKAIEVMLDLLQE